MDSLLVLELILELDIVELLELELLELDTFRFSEELMMDCS